MKKIILIGISTAALIAGNAEPKNYKVITNVFYESKSPITVEVTTKIKKTNCYMRNPKAKQKVCQMWATNIHLNISEEENLKFMKYENKQAKIKCDYNQKNGSTENCKIISINEWKEI